MKRSTLLRRLFRNRFVTSNKKFITLIFIDEGNDHGEILFKLLKRLLRFDTMQVVNIY